jgi:putative membrane protein
MKKTNSLLLALKGMAMGIAEVIPGVSGGTIAFITGIYERLIDAIKSILGPEVWTTWRKEGMKGAWQRADGTFILTLLIGMALGVIAGVFGVSHLLENYPVLLWAFFFGLIIASAIYIGRLVDKWTAAEVIALVAGAVVAYLITVLSPAQGSDSPLAVFFAGAIAISALILPGISGSFILLLMGMYTLIIPSIKSVLENQDLPSLIILGIFALGCLLGLATFSRVLSWMFRRYHSLTMALLAGFMIGSLNKIWPWRNVLSYRVNSKGEEVPFLEKSVSPGAFDGEPFLIGAVIMMVVGFVVVFGLEKLGEKG